MKKLDLLFSGKQYESAYKIIKALKDNSFNAYIVGGAVRDSFLYFLSQKKHISQNQKAKSYVKNSTDSNFLKNSKLINEFYNTTNIIKEFDLVTDATPEEIKKIFKHTILVGEKFGVVIVNDFGYNIELATFRKDLNYKDSRRPERVLYTKNMQEDAARRDFTINAMYYDVFEKKLYDFYDGENSLKQKQIISVGTAINRLKEDRLRIIRACRFASQLAFDLDKSLKNAILELRENEIETVKLVDNKKISTSNQNIEKKYNILKGVSEERKREELIKILNTPKPSIAFNLMRELNLLESFIPELKTLIGVEQPPNYHPEGDVWNHIMLGIDIASRESVKLLEINKNLNETEFAQKKTELMLAVLFHDMGKPLTITYEDRIRFNKHDIMSERVTKKIMERLKFSKKEIKTVSYMAKNHMRLGAGDRLRISKLKLIMSQDSFETEILLNLVDSLSSHGDDSMYKFLREKYNEFLEEQKLPLPILTGKLLIELGYKPSPKFSEIIEKAYDLQLEGKLNTENDAKEFLKNMALD